MADKRDYYEVLGVKKDATADEIKKAYRKVTKENHPDLHPGDKACEERFKEANEAYEVLSDEEKRKKYDQFGHAAFDPNAGFGGGFSGFSGGFGDFGDIFSSFGDIFGFGGGAQTRNPNAPRRGDNIRTQLNISFEEAAFGCEKELNIPRIETCTDCNGTGCAPGTTPEICPDCKGTGSVRTTQRTPFGMVQSTAACSKCRGTGKIIHQPCSTCRGMGSIRRAKKMTVKVPAGIDDGQTISKQGAGNAGVNGGPAGDLLITIIMRPHAIFERDGNSVLMMQDISYAQAALGAEIEVPVGATSKNAMVPMTTVNTRNILFICGGAFPDLEEIIKSRLTKQAGIGFNSDLKDKFDKDKTLLHKVTTEDIKKYGMIPEFVGRLPIICPLDSLDEDALVAILKEPKNAILKQYQKLLELDEVKLVFDDSALRAIAKKAKEKDTGARALRAIIEEFMLDIMYEIPKDDNIGKVTITGDFIEGKGGPIVEIRS